MKSFKLIIGILVIFILGMHTSQAQNGSVRVNMRMQDPYGEYLVDGQGRSLYLFEQDSAQQSTCYNKCAIAWPPLLTEGKKTSAGQGVQKALLGTVKRSDGSLQVTYNGHPLYYYEDDKNEGDVTGQDKDDYGAEWYLVKPSGEKMGDVEK